MAQADPDATWLMQGWLFYSEKDFWQEPQIEVRVSCTRKECPPCVCVHACVCECVRAHTCGSVCTHACVHACTSVHVYLFMFLCVCLPAYLPAHLTDPLLLGRPLSAECHLASYLYWISMLMWHPCGGVPLLSMEPPSYGACYIILGATKVLYCY
jgi:hypothetical protein